MSRLHQLIFEAGPCSESANCFNSGSKCDSCRLSPAGGSQTLWWPRSSAFKHPVLEQEKRDRKFSAQAAKHQAKARRDPGRITLLKKAVRAEEATNRNIIHATKNSGRSNKDGDHVHAGRVTLDTKLQTTRINPVVMVSEVDKVRSDAKRAGMFVGALVLRNRNGRGFVVLDEEDYARLVR